MRIVEPPEAPHDTRICIEDLVDTDIDESDIDELRDEKKRKQPGNGTQEQMKKTAKDRDPRTPEQKSSANSRRTNPNLIRWCTEAESYRDEDEATKSKIETEMVL